MLRFVLLISVFSAPLLQSASAERTIAVKVAKLDLALPNDSDAREELLARRFFEKHPPAVLVAEDRAAQWDAYAKQLVEIAASMDLDSENLSLCLKMLNRGRNEQTMLVPVREYVNPERNVPPEVTAAQQSVADARYETLRREMRENPEKFYERDLAIIPVGAFRATYGDAACWIIVCRWEYCPQGQSESLDHFKVWAIDAQSLKVVGFVSCD